MSSPTNALDVRQVSLTYGSFKALNKISLRVAPGSLAAVIGPNGAGKSSLVKAICGRADIDSGVIEISGVDSRRRAARLRLGVAPQRSALYAHMTAFENLACFGRQAGLSKVRANGRATAVLSMIGMDDDAGTLVSNMSGGMRQRINIAAAIVHEPALLILDEPAASLDPDGVQQINELIIMLKEGGYAVLLVTHDMNQAQVTSDQVIVLRRGEIVSAGPAQALISNACGEKVKLVIDRACAGELTANGFEQCPAQAHQCVKFLDCHSLIADEIASLQKKGVALHSLRIAMPDLNDVVASMRTGAAHVDDDARKERVA